MVVAFDLIFADVSSIIKKSDWTAEERCGFKKEHQNVVSDFVHATVQCCHHRTSHSNAQLVGATEKK